MLLRLISLACIACLIKGPAMAAPPPPNIAKTVTFIFLANDQGGPQIKNDAPVANGTGFLYSLRTSMVPADMAIW